MKRPNWQIVWNYLSQCEGATIELYPNRVEFCVIDNTLCAISQKLVFGKGPKEMETVYIPVDITLNNFIKICEKLPEHIILNCAFAAGMRKIKDEDQRSTINS